MPELIAFRACRGSVPAASSSTAIAVVGDVIPPRDRGRYQGIFGAVFGVRRSSGRCSAASSSTTSRGAGSSTSTCRSALVAFVVIGAVFRVRPVSVRANTRSTISALDYWLGRPLCDRPPSRAWAAHAGLGALSHIICAHRDLQSSLITGVRGRRGARSGGPILPLSAVLETATFAVTSAVGFVVGLSLFGAVDVSPALSADRQRHRAGTKSGSAVDAFDCSACS